LPPFQCVNPRTCPAHKFTLLNDFNGLSALSRNKRQNEKPSFRHAKNGTFRGGRRKVLKSSRAPNQQFRAFLCFQWFNRRFVSLLSRIVRFQ